MMDQAHWEARFVNRYIAKNRRARYKSLLADPLKRADALDRLNHGGRDFADGVLESLKGSSAQAENIIQRLADAGVSGKCYIMSDDDNLDRRVCGLTEGVEMVAGADWGSVLICPPVPVGLYRPEASEMSLYLVRSDAL